MKRIGILSDTHGTLDEAIFKHFDDVDEIWHAGDIGSMDLLNRLKAFKPTIAVYGNIDDWNIRNLCPKEAHFKCEDVNVWLTHIGGRPGRYDREVFLRLYHQPPQLFVCGHSHICKVEFDKRLNMLYVNPGAAGNYGIHKIKTLIKFDVEGSNMKNMVVIELGKKD